MQFVFHGTMDTLSQLEETLHRFNREQQQEFAILESTNNRLSLGVQRMGHVGGIVFHAALLEINGRVMMEGELQEDMTAGGLLEGILEGVLFLLWYALVGGLCFGLLSAGLGMDRSASLALALAAATVLLAGQRISVRHSNRRFKRKRREQTRELLTAYFGCEELSV